MFISDVSAAELFNLEPHGPDVWVGTGPRYPWGGLYGGQIVAVEVKTGKDTLSPEQIEYLADVDRAGGFAHECRDLQGLIKAIAGWKKQL